MKKLFVDEWGTTGLTNALAGIVALLLVASALVVGMNTLQSKICRAQAAVLDVKHDYGFWSGCVYQDPVTNEWVPKDNYRVRPGA